MIAVARGIALALFVAATLSPHSAHACTPSWSPVVDVLAPVGATHPANAAIVLRGINLTLSEVVVSVDGRLARLVTAPELSRTRFDGAPTVLAVRVVPEPAPGQVVRLTGDPCFYTECSVDIVFTVVEADHEAPTPALEAWWDVLVPARTEEEAFAEDSCGFSRHLAEVNAHVRLPPLDDSTFVRFDVLLRTDASRELRLLERMVLTPEEALDEYGGRFRFHVNEVGFPVDVGRLCVATALIDPSGNVTEVERCDPCRAGVEVASEESWCHAETRHCPADLGPAWEGDVCGCAASPRRSGGPAAWLAILFALMASLRARQDHGPCSRRRARRRLGS